jgi:hypothetical protein
MGEEIAAWLSGRTRRVLADVAAGYEGGLQVVVHDDYPEYAHLRAPSAGRG